MARRKSGTLILEKAYAQVTGGYSQLTKGGSSDEAMQVLTGHFPPSQKSVSGFSVDDLKDASAKKKPLVFNTPSDGSGKKGDLPYGMHRNHSYIFEGVITGVPDGKSKVILKKPLGFRRSAADSVRRSRQVRVDGQPFGSI